MLRILSVAVLVASTLVVTLGACESASSYDRAGFATEVKDGRLWVFRAGSKDYEQFKKHGEPVKMVTRIGEGPNGMTIKSSDGKVIDEYLAAK